MTVADALVWYVAYGSNLCADRFRTYLEGGRPPGATRTYPGARDRRAPLDDRPCRLPQPLHFALRSAVWGGGIPFLDHLPGDGPATLARGYLLRREQLDDVVAQENHREPGSVRVDVEAVVLAGRVALGPGCYDTLLHVGTWGGVPALTFTAPFTSSEVDGGSARAVYRGEEVLAERHGPSDAYLRLLAAGYAEAHGLDAVGVAEHLAGCRGVGRDAATLAAALGMGGADPR